MVRTLFLLGAVVCLSCLKTAAQTTCTTTTLRLDWRTLQAAASPDRTSGRGTNQVLFKRNFQTPTLAPLPGAAAPAHDLSTVFLPRWTASDLPIFCRIEHEIGLKLPVTVKFRLGSVEYVDWLEGK
jgi:hypothetical protein